MNSLNSLYERYDWYIFKNIWNNLNLSINLTKKKAQRRNEIWLWITRIHLKVKIYFICIVLELGFIIKIYKKKKLRYFSIFVEYTIV